MDGSLQEDRSREMPKATTSGRTVATLRFPLPPGPTTLEGLQQMGTSGAGIEAVSPRMSDLACLDVTHGFEAKPIRETFAGSPSRGGL